MYVPEETTPVIAQPEVAQPPAVATPIVAQPGFAQPPATHPEIAYIKYREAVRTYGNRDHISINKIPVYSPKKIEKCR